MINQNKFEEKKIILLLYKIVRRSKTTKIQEILVELRKNNEVEKEVLLKIFFELKDMFGINLNQAKYLLKERLPIQKLPELSNFIPAFENLKTILSAVFFYKPTELAKSQVMEVKKQLDSSLCSFGHSLVNAKICINHLRP